MSKKSPSSKRSLEESLLFMLDMSSHEPLTFERLFDTLAGKGYPLLLILLSLPFCQPLQIPGFSTPFGLMITLVGLRMAFGHRIWWPQFILQKKISRTTLEKVVKKSIWLIKKMKKWLHPRWSWMYAHPGLHVVHGLVIACLGIFLALPLPIPLSNLIAAWSIFLMGLGLLEDDGLLISLGYLIGIVCLVMLVFILFSLNAFFSYVKNSH
jgi:hypothetical protein